MPERDELDRLIDSELARYAEPRAGLEQRILARVESESSRQSWLLHGWQLWVSAGALATAIVLAVGIPRLMHRDATVNIAGVTSSNRAPVSPRATVPGIHVQAPHSTQTAKNASRRSKPIEIAERPRQPKLDVFPAPQPLSAEEQALVSIATGSSDLGRQNLIDSQRELNTPLQISEINIPPLTKPDEGNK